MFGSTLQLVHDWRPLLVIVFVRLLKALYIDYIHCLYVQEMHNTSIVWLCVNVNFSFFTHRPNDNAMKA